MQIQFQWNNKLYHSNLNEGIDLSISFNEEFDQVNCFYAPFFSSQAYKSGSFIGSVKEGGPVNYYNTLINIHGNGTHTECVGHISPNRESVNKVFNDFFGMAYLLSVYPTKLDNGDRVITESSLELLWNDIMPTDFLILRSLPNTENKRHMHYSGTNPPFLSEQAIRFLNAKGIKHLLVDLPSIDKEQDGGALAAHKAFWSADRAEHCTITELIYVPDFLKDGYYLINLQMASIEQDAAPSRPVLFRIHE
jgi:kynurenine formamidase